MEQLSNLRWQLNKAGSKVLPRGQTWQRRMKRKKIMQKQSNITTKLSKKIPLLPTHV